YFSCGVSSFSFRLCNIWGNSFFTDNLFLISSDFLIYIGIHHFWKLRCWFLNLLDSCVRRRSQSLHLCVFRNNKICVLRNNWICVFQINRIFNIWKIGYPGRLRDCWWTKFFFRNFILDFRNYLFNLRFIIT
uniref:Uncharacterized protein n=1 Tax=Ciona intestinalis TaxID=7719 RepID=H2XS42_CIOIN